jgi:hypothetical protein
MLVDDVLTIKVTRPDGTHKTFTYDSSDNCSGHEYPLNPTNLSYMFEPGRNTISLIAADKCGGFEEIPTIYLIPS